MQLHPELAPLFANAPAPKSPSETVIADERVAFAANGAALPRHPVARIADHKVAVDGGEIDVRLYYPQAEGPLPLLIFIHGGGFLFGDVDTHDAMSRSLCIHTRAVVAAIAYRLAPEHKFPIPLEDSLAGARWLVERAEALGCDPARILIGGESAGGNLAAVIARHLPEAFAGQILGYPVVDMRMTEGAMARDDVWPGGLTPAQGRWIRDQYLVSPDQAGNPDASPLLAESVAGLPPAFVLTAEVDPLREEGEAYAMRLAAAGVPVTIRRYPGMPHGFFFLPDAFPCVAQPYRDIARFMTSL